MIKTFSDAKLQLMMVGEGHQKGIARTFSHLAQDAKEENIQQLGELLQSISADTFDCTIVTTSYQLDTK
ncbi:hypothetical protein ABTQ33_03805 [Paucilactobacillus suebicus]|uniref:DUF1659 domain-containing protein n=1 Tax=Paucilactobacillus suebicus DSM 5007 = KCTC 3549 TaxID=1423807 RepID=A0A0R1W790_9LACO|nr:hypothetical protein [Paucilactobacillus suebicus]KRM13285.1 hypothetical protein FD16_GL000760 [Paucilactobacillus suebicus DSM 5007 = KCTC 3549]